MSRDLILDVVAKKNSRDLSTLADEFDRLAKRTDDAGRKMHQTGTFSQYLDDQLAKTKVKVHELGQEFERTGDKDVFAKLRGTQSNLKSLERIKTDLSKALGDAGSDGGREMSKHLSASLQGAEGTPGMGPVLTGVIVGAVGAALPAVNGLILGAAGLGGIGLGIAGQFHDPAVQAAIGDMGHNLMAELERDTVAFKQPLIGAAGTFGAALGQALNSINFNRLSGLVQPLAGGLGGLFTGMMPGFNHALEASEPVIRALAQELPGLGRALGDMFDDFARGGPGAEEGLRALLMLMEGLAEGTGKTVEAFSGFYHEVVRVEDNVANFVDGFAHGIPVVGAMADKTKSFLDHIRYGSGDVVTFGKLLGETADSANEKFEALAAAINKTRVTGDTLAGSMAAKLFATTMSMDEATLHWHESLTNLNDTLKQHHQDLRETTKDGEANREAILSAVQANMAQYQAFIAVGGSAKDAAAQYDQNTLALERQLRQAGLTQAQIDTLIGKYKGIPDEVNTRLQFEGLEVAINRMDTLLRQLNHLPTGKEITIKQNFITVGEAIGHHASGGSARGMFEVGEQGPEYITLANTAGPAYVTPNSAINGAANGGGGQVLGVIEVRVTNAVTGEVIRTELVNVARQRGYRTVDALLPVGSAR